MSSPVELFIDNQSRQNIPMSVSTVTAPLTGQALLSKLTDLSSMTRSDKARACGYVVSKHGKERVQLSEFMAAVLSAKGIEIDPEVKTGSRGRSASYRVTVHQNGTMVIGKSYTEKMGLKSGDELSIKLGYKHIKLEQVVEE